MKKTEKSSSTFIFIAVFFVFLAIRAFMKRLTPNDKILNVAFSQLGTKEIVGAQHNQDVLRYFNDIGFTKIDDDETAWCSAFANWVAMKAGCQRSGSLMARSWLSVGSVVQQDQLIPGDVVILWRGTPNGTTGHVGFYVDHDDSNIHLLGGNQSNEVNISKYPYNRILGFRRLSTI